MLKCQARIYKTYKKAKADVYWPETVYGPALKHILDMEVCGGDVKLTVSTAYDGCSCCSSPRLEIEAECSRCKNPYVPGSLDFNYNAEKVINDLLNRD